ncbi:putative FAD-dependent monooxygenase [Seiridium cardinale]|uniref:FAD-dependent monooxygenase n=1 Tax=Seiridium cardinale TaxID=138064 RepID=A0ABR2Y7V9_9PEZI
MPGLLGKQDFHILIVGAGLTGLILAQALRKLAEENKACDSQVNITFEVFERDPSAFYRGGGWSLTIHWALTDLRNILPPDIMARFEECLVNRDAAAEGNAGTFQYLNLRTKEPVHSWPIPFGMAVRVAREKLLALMMTDLDIQYAKQVSDLAWPDSEHVTVKFADGTAATGKMVVGCDGARSGVRRSLCPTTGHGKRLPVRMVGVRVDYPLEKVAPCLAADPHFFQGGDPDVDAYFWFSFIHMPRSQDVADRATAKATCQMMLSWPHSETDSETEMPATNEARLVRMKELAEPWANPARDLVLSIPSDTEIREIVLEDWPPSTGGWDNHGGRVTLLGDAAHCMTMFRGEAANHGVMDVNFLVKALAGLHQESGDVGSSERLAAAVDKYEEEMISRTYPAALKSRQACVDANHFASVNENSPLVTRRASRD